MKNILSVHNIIHIFNFDSLQGSCHRTRPLYPPVKTAKQRLSRIPRGKELNSFNYEPALRYAPLQLGLRGVALHLCESCQTGAVLNQIRSPSFRSHRSEDALLTIEIVFLKQRMHSDPPKRRNLPQLPNLPTQSTSAMMKAAARCSPWPALRSRSLRCKKLLGLLLLLRQNASCNQLVLNSYQHCRVSSLVDCLKTYEVHSWLPTSFVTALKT